MQLEVGARWFGKGKLSSLPVGVAQQRWWWGEERDEGVKGKEEIDQKIT